MPSHIGEALTRSSDAVALGALAGTLPYMAPEVLAGSTADERSDIWALGVMLYEMAAGELPFKGRTEFDLTASILRAPAQSLPAHVPPMIRAVIQRCLMKDPVHRYQQAGETRAALEAIQSDVAISPAAVSQATGARSLRPLVLATIGIAIVAVAAAIWFGRDRRSQWERVASDGRLTLAVASDQPVFDPAISGDGKMLCYGVEVTEGRTDLFVRRVAGGALVKLTDDAARESWPRFSPDGEWIAFTRRESHDGISEVRVVPALGGDAVSRIAGASSAVWSPDGKRLAFLKRTPTGGAELTVAAVDGSNPRTLLSSDSAFPFMRDPAWSPDGADLAVVRGTGGIAGEIWIVPEAGGQPRRPFTDPPEVFADSPVFTMDGSGLIYSSNRGGATNIWLYPRRGGAPVRLTTGPGPDTVPTAASDGTIAFINSRWRNTLELHRLAGGPTRTLTSHAPFLWAPVFSPDGTEVAFSRSEFDGSWHIWTVPVDGGAPKRLTATASGEVYPRYAPDGSRLFFHTWGTPRRIGRVSRDGGSVAMLSFGDASDAFPDVSPDGKWMALTRTDRDAERIYIVPVGGGESRLLTPSVGAVARWSPDGRSIVFAGSRGYGAGIFLFDADGRHERRLTTTGGWPVWWPDGRRIGYIAIGRNGDQEIHVVPAGGGDPAPLPQIRFNGSNHPFGLSPDGTLLAVTNSVHVSDDIWLLEPKQRE
jgi:Tol biopolymer transport system component